MTSGTKIGGGVRVERHDPDVVAKTIEAKQKLAMADEEVKVVTRAEALEVEERQAFRGYYNAIDRLAKAKVDHYEAKLRWKRAIKARQKEEAHG